MIIKKNYQSKTFDSRFELEIKADTKSRKAVLTTNRKGLFLPNKRASTN